MYLKEGGITMKVNVRGRDIEVHTGMANYHSKLYNELVDEKLLVTYLNAEYGRDWKERLQNASDEELTNTVQAGLKFEELGTPADSYDEYMSENCNK
jgi:hypothetical protein